MRTLLALWAVGCLLHAQAQRFTITSCPASSGVLKADFNARYGDTNTHAEYMLALRRAFTGDKGGRYVHYTMHVEGTVEQDYYFSIPQGRSYPAGLVSLASKSVHSSTVESKAELRALLQDTLAIWDTLCVRMRLLDADLAHDGYFLLWTDPRDGVQYKSALPVSGDTLQMNGALFGTLQEPFIPVRLRHTALRKQDLATFVLRVMTDEEKKDLLEHVCQAAQKLQLEDPVQRGLLLHQYCRAQYGHVPLEQLPPAPCADAMDR